MRQVFGLGRDVAPRTCLSCVRRVSVTKEERWFSIALPEGVQDGWTLRREGLGETRLEPERGQLRAQLEPGPLVLRVHVEEHENFTRTEMI